MRREGESEKLVGTSGCVVVAWFMSCLILSCLILPTSSIRASTEKPSRHLEGALSSADAALLLEQPPLMGDSSHEESADINRGNLTDGVWKAFPPPSGRLAHTGVYDSRRNRMLIFGGSGGPGNDVWALSLGKMPAWQRILTEGSSPSGRTSASAIYDSIGDRMIVFGGHDRTGELNDIWALSLAPPTWSRQLALRGPHPMNVTRKPQFTTR